MEYYAQIGLLIDLMENQPEWEGETSAFYKVLEAVAEAKEINPRNEPSWPKSASWLDRRINEGMAVLTESGLSVVKCDRASGAIWTIGRKF